MPLIPFEPMRHMDQWRRDLDRFFQDGFGMWSEFGSPRVDVYETEQEVVAHCELPGLEKKEDVQIHVDHQSLTIYGQISRNRETNEEQMHRKERFVGRFQRTVSLPVPVKTEGTKATYKNGILEVRMPKADKHQGTRIDIDFH